MNTICPQPVNKKATQAASPKFLELWMLYTVLLALLFSNKILIKLAKLKNILNCETKNIILQFEKGTH